MNWQQIAADALRECGQEIHAPAFSYAMHHLADQLAQTANNFIEDELPQILRDQDDAAEAMHWHRKIDEARGK